MRTCRLLVSVLAYADEGTEKVELCAGHRVTVMNEERGPFVLCLTESGDGVWIPEQYVSHAAAEPISLAGDHFRSPATSPTNGATHGQVNICAGPTPVREENRQGKLVRESLSRHIAKAIFESDEYARESEVELAQVIDRAIQNIVRLEVGV
jgi:hypothetical protein